MRTAKLPLLAVSAALLAPASAHAFGAATVGVDSTYAGYGSAVLADGRWLTAAEDAALAANGIVWTDARRTDNSGHAWVSQDTASDHWVTLEWGSAQRIDGLELAWGSSGYRPAGYRVERWDGSAWQPVVAHGAPAGQVETLDFPAAVTTTRLRIVQPSGRGGSARPNVMVLQEARARFAPEVDSSYGGYDATPLDDGDWVTEGEDAAMDADGVGATTAQRLGNGGGTWASADAAGEHWAELAWSTPRAVTAVTIAWALPQWRPQEYRIDAWIAGGWQAILSNGTPAQLSQRVRLLAPVTTTRLRLVQPNGRGNAAHPNLMGLQELQAHGEKTPDADYADAVDAALGSGADLLGEQALAKPSGPSWDDVADYLLPLGDAGPLTQSSAYYLPIGRSDSTAGDGATRGLHVADGSQILADSAGAARATSIYVGAGSPTGWARPGGKELFGAERDRLAPPQLADDGLPILQTEYVDRAGIRYRQESFTTRLDGVSPLVSFVKLTANRNGASATAAKVRFRVAGAGALTASGQQLLSGGSEIAAFSGRPRLLGQDLVHTLDLSDGDDHSVYFARPLAPVSSGAVAVDATAYATARAEQVSYWERKLAAGAGVSVPEPRVMDAMRASLVQNLQLGTRYSAGNAYETTFPPESAHNAATLARYGFEDYAKTAYEELLRNPLHATLPTFDSGERLAGGAEYWFLTRDDSLLTLRRPSASETIYEQLAANLKRQVDTPKVRCDGLPDAENVDGDTATAGCSTHGDAIAWRGLRDVATIWGLTGSGALNRTFAGTAATLKTNLLAAVGSSSTTLADGSVFTPERLLEPIAPYDPLTGTTTGSYWNLVNPYFSASELIDPASRAGLDRIGFGLRHGAYLLGTQRFNYSGTAVGSCNAGGLTGYRTSGIDHVYGFNTVRTLAAADLPDRLALALYGTLAHALTRGTYVGGEGAAIGVCPGESTRGFYLPPNSTQSATFLEVLRLLLVQERTNADGVPDALRLGFATPRGWLADGKSFGVTAMPTSFGELTYEVRSNLGAGTVRATVEVPRRDPLGSLELRLRLPAGWRVQSAVAGGASVPVTGETIDLSGSTGTVEVTATVTR